MKLTKEEMIFMALIQSFVDPSKYDVKCPYSMNPVGICIHNTANDAPAKNEANYMKTNNNEVSFHIAIDDVEAIQTIPFNRNAWAAGDGGKGDGNRNYIHVEICYSKSGGSRFIEAEKRAAKEVAALLKSYGWGIDRIRKHQDFSGKYCPHRTLDMGYSRFVDMIKAELGSANPSNPIQPSAPSVASGTYYRVVAGSYSERANADAMVERLKQEGISAFLLPVESNGKTFLRVIAGSYKERENAEKQMQELIAKGYNAFIAVYDSEDNRVPSNPTQAPAPATPSITVGAKVNIKSSAVNYATGQRIPDEQKGSKVHTVQQISGDRSLLQEIISWVYTKDLALVGSSSSASTSNKQYVNLPPSATGWNVYPTNKAPVTGNQCGRLNPAKFGGLSYEVLGNPQAHVYTIQTGDFGRVNIYAGPDTSAKVSTTKMY